MDVARVSLAFDMCCNVSSSMFPQNFGNLNKGLPGIISLVVVLGDVTSVATNINPWGLICTTRLLLVC